MKLADIRIQPLDQSLIALDKWFYQYQSRSIADKAAAKMRFESKYRSVKGPVQRAILLPFDDFMAAQFAPLHQYESWALHGEDPTGYLGFVNRPTQWAAVLFASHIDQQDIIVNLHDLASDIQVQKRIEELLRNNKITGNVETIYSGNDGNPINEVIIRSRQKYYVPTFYKTFQKNHSPVTGEWLPYNELLTRY